MQLLTAVACMAFSACGAAQDFSQSRGPAPGGDWQRLKALPSHARIHVTGDKAKTTCLVDSVDDVLLTCISPGGRRYEFTRSQVKEVRLSKKSSSAVRGAVLGAGIGAGAGALIGAGINQNDKNSFVSQGATTGAGAAVGAVGGGLVGALAGYARNPFASPVIYQKH